MLREQRRGLAIGIGIGLAWSIGKVTVPELTQQGIDRGIDQNGNLWFWAGLIALAGVLAGLMTALRRWYAFRESRWTETACASGSTSTCCDCTSATTTAPRPVS